MNANTPLPDAGMDTHRNSHRDSLSAWTHSHVFGQHRRRPGERRTLLVIALTAVTMVVEIAAGLLFGSMALLADGLHMASHTLALGISAVAYVYARRFAADPRFSFGTGKVNALGGFTGALLLAGFALAMVWESVHRLLEPTVIVYDRAIAIALLGLAVNAASAWILGGSDGHDHPAHPGHRPVDEHGHAHDHPHHEHRHHDHHHDHNLRAAYLHVLADALTSVLAIAALLGGKYAGWDWLDPAIAILGALLIARWSWGLLADTSRVLLDYQAPEPLRETLREAVERHGADRVADLHLWSVGPGLHALEMVVLTHDALSADDIKARLPDELGIVHATVEIHRCCQ